MVARNANIRVTFDRDMDHTTLNSSTITVVGSRSGSHVATYTYNSRIVTIDPALDFAPGETVTVTVTRDVAAVDGGRAASVFVSQFKTLTSPSDPISVSGNLSTSTTWTAGNVYLFNSDLTVNAGTTLTIEAGVVVKFGVTTYSGSVDNPRAAERNYRLIVNGTLDLRGTPTENVVFTSAYDDEYGGDSNNDGTATTPSHYDWGYIQINNSTTKLTTYLIRSGGYRDDDTSSSSSWHNYQVWVSNSSPVIRDCTFERGLIRFCTTKLSGVRQQPADFGKHLESADHGCGKQHSEYDTDHFWQHADVIHLVGERSLRHLCDGQRGFRCFAEEHGTSGHRQREHV